MHREFDSADSPFQSRSQVSLYLFTALIGALLAADLWPLLARWLGDQGLSTYTWSTRELYGYRFGLLAAILGGARVLYGSLEKLADGKVTADLAVALACLAAILIGEPIVAAEVVFIGLVGECLEAFTFDRTQRALGQLTELFPQRCWVLRDGVEVRTFTKDLMPGNQIVIKPGGKIPADGVVIAGMSAVDERALTGESIPRDRSTGDTVLAGSVVLNGTLTVDAKKVAKQTVAGQVIELTSQALKEKSTGERQADKLAKNFLPIVLGLALLVFVINLGMQYSSTPVEGRKFSFAAASRVAIYPTLAVLVVACPCPLVLATPAAVIAALGRLAGTGVLVKSGAALERLAQIKSIAFDKTGTLTEGQLELGDIHLSPGINTEELLWIAGSVEQHSEHPVAKLIVTECKKRTIQIDPTSDFQAVPGNGVSAKLRDETIHVGTLRFVDPHANAPQDWLTALEATGQSPLFISRNGQLLGAIGSRDRVRDDALHVLSELRNLGLSPIKLLTGDRASVAKAIAANLPIDEVHAELLPTQKPEQLGEFTAFVGDGINDAPALAKAHVGIAIGTGTEIAAEAGDVVMMGDPLKPLPLLIRLSRETAAVIRQNIIWFGFGVNLFGVLLTGILWPLFAPSADWYEKAPLAGVLYHQLGSLLVLLNSMRLLAFERESTSKAMSKVRLASRGFDRWINTIHIDDAFHWIAHRWKMVSINVAIVGIAIWLFTGLTIIEANEVGVLQRFGAVRDDLTPGLHLRWPWPVESVTRVRPAEVRTVEIGFRLPNTEKARELELARSEQAKLRAMLPDAQTWSSAHADGVSRVTDESLMLTGDGDLIEILATVRYVPSDPRTFALAVKDVEPIIRSATESVLRELAASRPFQQLLASGRVEFESAVALGINKRLSEAAPNGLGITITGVNVHDMHPPQQVVKDYHAVAEAIQKRDRVVNDANAEASRIKSRAEADAQKMVRTSEADAHTRLSEAKAARDIFLEWHAKRTQLPTIVELHLERELEAKVGAGGDREKVTKDIQTKREQMLTVNRGLTDFRLALEAIVAVLRTRDKILIDADKLPGTRKLYLIDPDFLPRVVPPVVRPMTGEQN